MELIDHIGVPEFSLNKGIVTQYIRGIFNFFLLAQILILYHFASCLIFLILPLFPEVAKRIRNWLTKDFWNLCFVLLKMNNVAFEVTGQIHNGRSVLLCNHQSIVDYIALSYLSTQVDHPDDELNSPQVVFFSWGFFWKIPTLKLINNMVKLDENWELEPTYCRYIFDKVVKESQNDWFVIFPEVNSFTYKNKYKQSVYGEKFYLPILNHLLYPRFPPVNSLIQILKNENDIPCSFYDITIVYERNDNNLVKSSRFQPPTLFEIFSTTSNITIKLNISTANMEKIPLKRKKVEKWLEKLWIDKDVYLENIKC